MFVIGTAGHVDHGKSTLIKALTGIDPDRLREEKDRGMTIDLGFAWLELPSGREVSIVDVPGHERFIKNMLAGVGGIDLALLVVAADEAVMPQTKEHLAILDLLQIKRGVVALTKKDLVDTDWQELVSAEVEEILLGTSLEGSPIIPVSAYTQDGLPELVRCIDSTLAQTPPRKDTGRPRLPIDRSFTIPGFGSVITGTLTDGQLIVGQEIELVLAQKRARIRGLQSHKKTEDHALPGTRTAVNLSGISHEEVHRGDVVTIPGWLQSSQVVDVRLRLIPDAPKALKHNAPITFHTNTSETLARVRHLDHIELQPGETGWAQIKLQNAVPVVRSDFFVIRWSDVTVGGGNIVDTNPKRHRRFHAPTLQHLEVLEHGSEKDVTLEALNSLGATNVQRLAQHANLSVENVRIQLASLIQDGEIVTLGTNKTVFLSNTTWLQVIDRAKVTLDTYHSQYPLRHGAPREEIRNRLMLESQISTLALQRLVEENIIEEVNASLKLPEHSSKVSGEQQQQLDQYLQLLDANPFAPQIATVPNIDLLNLLVEEGKIVKVSETVIFARSAYQQMLDDVITHLRTHGSITVAQVRDMFGTSRKYALGLMEHLDQRHLTRRVGDERVLR